MSVRASAVFLVAWGGLDPQARAQTPCAEPVTSSQIDLQLQSAETAYGDLDAQGFLRLVDQINASLPCVDEELPRALVARLHRAQGLRAWLVRDEQRTRQAFAAARTDAPDYRIPTSLVPEDHPLRLDYVALQLDTLHETSLPQPKDGYVVVDGAQTSQRPATWPALVQWMSVGGGVNSTAYLWPEDPAPVWPTRELPASLTEQARRPRVGLLVGAGAAALASGGLYFAATQARDHYDDLATPDSELDALRDKVNGLQGASLGVGAVAVGLCVTGLLPVLAR